MLTKRRICVSIPIINTQSANDKLESVLANIDTAIQKGADIVECRFDFLKDFDQIDHYIKILSRYKDRCIYTLRPVNEGGHFSNDHIKRIHILQKLIEAKPLLVDIEYELVSKNDEFADYLENNNSRILVSWHDFAKTPLHDELLTIINKMRVYSPYLKIVTTASNTDDSITMLKLYQSVDTHINLIAFAMGEAGTISRILSTIIGDSPFTYASLDAPIAPGQLSIDQMKVFEKLFESKLI